MPPSTHAKYRPDIDGLRALAVFSVIGFHAFPGWVKGGFIGVDIFFVISGFLISGIIFDGLESGKFSFTGFYARRIKRIFPALLLVLAACYAFGWFALFSDEYKQLGKHIAGGAGFISNFLFWNEAGYFDKAAETKPLLHLWSLGVEEQFYIFWPLLLPFVWRKRFNVLAVIIFIAAVSFLLNVGRIQRPVEIFYSPGARLWELLTGSCLAYLVRYKPNPSMGITERIGAIMPAIFTKKVSPQTRTAFRNTLSITGGILIVAAVLFLSKNAAFPGWWALAPVLGAYLIISAGPHAWLNRKVLSHQFLVWIGLISYPLYLWHWPLLSFARIVESSTPGWKIRVAAVAASVLLAALTTLLIERPVRFGKGDFCSNKTKVFVLCAFMCLIGMASYVTYAHDGLESRSSMQSYQDNKDQLVRTPPKDGECKAYLGIDNPLFPYCRFSKADSAETAALIGDSHAHVTFPGLGELMKEKGKNLIMLANSSCPPFIGAVTGNNDRERKECSAQIREMLNLVTSKLDIKDVYITTRGPVYISGNGFGEAEKDYRDRPIQSDDSAMMDNTPSEIFRLSLQNTVAALRHAGKNVYYILENPETGIDPSVCIERPFRPDRSSDCGIERSVVLERQAAYREILKSTKDLTVIDPLSAFCPEETCKLVDDGKLLYADDNHLSVDGSRFMAKKVLVGF
ncbi:MAG: acyltransferase family protein [Alphaproteobacteria bacterium]|nr:acyltransferase family protein [Alphaproteobacteria bacterium]